MKMFRLSLKKKHIEVFIWFCGAVFKAIDAGVNEKVVKDINAVLKEKYLSGMKINI